MRTSLWHSMIDLDGDIFDFDGPLGSEGADITRVSESHYHVRLGISPSIDHPRWVNRLQLKVTRRDPGTPLRLDVSRPPEPAYWFNEYTASMSADGEEWTPLRWQSGQRQEQDTLVIPPTHHPEVIIGNQVPASAGRVEREVRALAASPFVVVHEVGRSLGGRPILRVTVSATPEAPAARRWSHYVVNHHPGEGNAIWRIIGLLRWAVSPEADRFRTHNILHAIIMASPDSPSKGWSRCNAEGYDMNRSYRPRGADRARQAHESHLCQRDFESLMASACPVTTCWFMHTWPGLMAPFVLPGPELPALGGVDALACALRDHDKWGYCNPLGEYGPDKARAHPTHWNNGPWLDHGVTSLLVEGTGGLIHQHQNIACGQLIGRAIEQVYRQSV